MSQHYKVNWKRQRRALQLPENNQWTTGFPPSAWEVHFEPTEPTKRRLQKLELNEYPATPAGFLVGQFAPITGLSVAENKVRRRYKLLDVVLNQFPETPTVAAVPPSDVLEKAILRKQTAFRLQDVVISDYGDAVAPPGPSADDFPDNWTYQDPRRKQTKYRVLNVHDLQNYETGTAHSFPSNFLVEAIKRRITRYRLTVDDREERVELNSFPPAATPAGLEPAFVPPKIFRRNGVTYHLITPELNSYPATSADFLVGFFASITGLSVTVNKVSFKRTLQELPTHIQKSEPFGAETSMLLDYPIQPKKTGFDVSLLTIEPIDFIAPFDIGALPPEEIDFGHSLLNPDAVPDSENRYNICQRSGFKALPGELVRDGYGYWVLPRFAETRHPQDFIKSRAEKLEGPQQPEQDDVFVDVPELDFSGELPADPQDILDHLLIAEDGSRLLIRIAPPAALLISE